MKRWAACSLSLGMLAAVSACDVQDSTGDSLEVGRSSGAVTFAELDQVCSLKRWVGITLFGNGTLRRGCPNSVEVGTVGAWHLQWLTGTSEPAQPGLAKVCSYEWVSGSATDPRPYLDYLPSDSGRPWYEWLSRDCQIVAPFGDSVHMPIEIGGLFNSELLDQVDALESYPVGRGLSLNPVRVSIVDADPTTNGGPLTPGSSGHGYALGRLVQNVGCPQLSGCPVQVEQELALQHTAFDQVNTVRGGFSGTLWTLATAIHRVVDRYVAGTLAGTAPKHLVINLSLGWDPQWGGIFASSPDELNLEYPGQRAVYDALVRARCFGAAIFVAAGNTDHERVDGYDAGAALPARWEFAPAPSAAQCAAFEGSKYSELAMHFSYPPVPSRDTDYRPLLFAIAGVNGDDSLLVNARPKSTTRIMAPGAFGSGVIPPFTPEGIPGGGSRSYRYSIATRVMTGSSISSALASATAALVWSYRPDLTVAQVAEAMYKSGAPLTKGDSQYLYTCLSDKCVGNPSRLSVCRTLASVCAKGGGSCPTSRWRCATEEPFAGTVSQLDETAYQKLLSMNAPVVEKDYSGFSTSKDLQQCVLPTGYTMPAISTQPGIGWCNTCSLVMADMVDSRVNVLMRIDDSFTGTILDPYVVVYDSNGKLLQKIDLPVDAAKPGETVLMNNLKANVNLKDVTTASIKGTILSTGFQVISMTTAQPLAIKYPVNF